MSTPPTRTSEDALGPVQVPADAYYGAQTQRAVENFDISGVVLGDFQSALADLELDRLLVVHAGEEQFPLAESIDAVPARRVLGDGLAAV